VIKHNNRVAQGLSPLMFYILLLWFIITSF
uniref:Uncharacterized protein n=1 Tax=Amphimedon queenslandica TaxID=400682 RepID=A0A1X7UD03_AMPQE